MKDIIRQAVADAAEYLFVNGVHDQRELLSMPTENLLVYARREREAAAEAGRRDQLADFVARPVIDSVLIAGPEGEIARTGGFVGRCLMVGTHAYDKRRREIADAAQDLVMNEGYEYKFLSMQNGDLIIAYAKARKDQRDSPEDDTLEVPRALLERIEKKLGEALHPMTCGCLDELRKLL